MASDRMMMLSSGNDTEAERLRRVLGAPDLRRLIDRLVRRIQRGRPLHGAVTLENASAAERRAIASLLGRPVGRGASVSVSLRHLEETLRRAGVVDDLRRAVEVVAGPIKSGADAQAAESARREAVLSAATSSSHASEGWYIGWVDELASDGTLTRLLRRGEEGLVRQATAVLQSVCGAESGAALPLPVLAERITGDTKALSGTPLASLVLRALARRESQPAPTTRTDARNLWEKVGVLVDDLASQVLVLNLRAKGTGLASWLCEAADSAVPFRITLHQLVTTPIVPEAKEVFVCENPAVLRVAAAECGAACAPLVCTEGQPSEAAHRLLSTCVSAGVTLRWRGDFDWTGLRTTSTALARYAAIPWRMSRSDYETALAAGESEPLRGTPSESPWDEELSAHMRRTGRAVMEERLIPALLTNLC